MIRRVFCSIPKKINTCNICKKVLDDSFRDMVPNDNQIIKDEIIRRDHYLKQSIESRTYMMGYFLASGATFLGFIQAIPMYTTSVPYMFAVSSGLFLFTSKLCAIEMKDFYEMYKEVDNALLEKQYKNNVTHKS